MSWGVNPLPLLPLHVLAAYRGVKKEETLAYGGDNGR
jgi:hypothetical protein